ncbi:MAG: hypothetical protein WDN46_14630 [Methylocella sp.]
MAIAIGVIDIKATRVPIVFPLAAVSTLGIAQLFLGANPLIVFMCVAAITVTFIPLHIFGRDLYSIFALVFSTRYLGVALLAKTFHGQTLESNLFDPYPTYALTLLLMIIETSVILLARKLDPGTTLFPFPTDLQSLRKLAPIAYSIGFVGVVIAGRLKPAEGVASAGIVFNLASTLSTLCALGFIAEASYSIEKSNGRSLFTPLLIFMFLFILLAVIALNERGFLLNCLIGIGVVAFIYRALHFRYIVVGILFAAFFSSFLSPLILYLRSQRTMEITQFIELGQETAIKMIVDPNFRKVVNDTVQYRSLDDLNEVPPYDYYGNRSNVLNRLSFIGLLDAVYNATKSHNLFGSEALERSINMNRPSFLGPKLGVGMGDWMSWQLGMGAPGVISFLNFGLPMEGLATWGVIGFITYPFIFMLPVLLIFGRISSFRLATPVSVLMFIALQHSIFEDTSDGFIGTVLRDAPILLLLLFSLYSIFFRRSSSAASNPIPSSAQR